MNDPTPSVARRGSAPVPGEARPPGLDLYWIPLGAGARVVRVSGTVYEAVSALLQRRPRRALYHSALVAITDDGRSLAGDFDAQCRQAFRNIEKTLVDAGAKLGDLVTMTVSLIDARYTTRMTELRADIFKKDFPASAAIAVSGFANPDILIEIQGIAVIAQLK